MYDYNTQLGIQRERMKRFVSMFYAVSMVILFLSTANVTTAEVYINAFPEDVTVSGGDALDIPVFFWGHGFTGKPIELLIWKETIESSEKEYLGPGGWVPFTDTAAVQPFLYLESMIEYANIRWRVFESTAGMTPFTLNICMKDVETGSESCGQRKIYINPSL